MPAKAKAALKKAAPSPKKAAAPPKASPKKAAPKKKAIAKSVCFEYLIKIPCFLTFCSCDCF